MFGKGQCALCPRALAPRGYRYVYVAIYGNLKGAAEPTYSEMIRRRAHGRCVKKLTTPEKTS